MRFLHCVFLAAGIFASLATAQDAQKHLGHPIQESLQNEPSPNTVPKNFAAILPSPLAQLVVTSRPYPQCGDNEIIIKNHIVAINPVDWKIQSPMGRNFNLTYPVILGEDVAGEVVEVGSEIKSKFSVGDRVMAHPLGLGNGAAYGGFQLYPVLKAATVSRIPDSITFKEAAVLPLSISTAAAGLFMKSTLGLEYPSVDAETSQRAKGSTLLLWGCSSSVGSSVVQLATAAGYSLITTATVSRIPDSITFKEAAVLPLSISTAAAGLFMKSTLGLEYPSVDAETSQRAKGSTLLLWGCSSSVGSSVVQLATAAGYSLITTASPGNFRYCKALGADQVLDYHDVDIVEKLIGHLKGRKVVGAYDAIGSEVTVRQSATILHALGGGKIASVGLAPEVFSDVKVSRVSSGNIVTQEPEVAEQIWGEFVPWALESGKLVARPKALVVGKGLENVQAGLDRQKEGVSALKIEVVLN